VSQVAPVVPAGIGWQTPLPSLAMYPEQHCVALAACSPEGTHGFDAQVPPPVPAMQVREQQSASLVQLSPADSQNGVVH
jgi:hypothetical protein